MLEDLTSIDKKHLLEAIDVAWRSRNEGNHPFGAVLADNDGTVLLKAENSVVTDSDVTAHAETNLVRLASQRFDARQLTNCTFYSSAEPCAMCSGAIYWAGLRRVVYALGESDLLALTGAHAENPTMSLPCREVFARGQRQITVVGPVSLQQACRVHENFWT